MNYKKALVTGGAGFIGSHLVETLHKNNIEVLVVDNLLTGKKENLNSLNLENTIYGDVGLEDNLEHIKNFNPDVCFHLAAQSSVVISVEDPLLDFEHNLLQPVQLIKTLLETDCKQFIFTSSGGTIFGEPDVIPTSEVDYGGEPASPYGLAKKKLNELIEIMLEDEEMSYSIMNLSNVYGPRQDPHGEAGVMSIFTGKLLNNETPTIYGDGEQTRDYVYVLDVVDALIKSSESDENLFLNIGTGVETSVNDLVSILSEKISWDGKAEYKPKREGELLRSVLNNQRAKDQIGWEPAHTLDTGLNGLIDWFKNKG
jgi:UDP-glucose 4-epimerase